VILAGVFTRATVNTIVWALGPLVWALSMLLSILVLGAALIAMLLLLPLFWLLDGRQFKFKAVRINTSSRFSNPNFKDTAARANEVPDAIRVVLAAGVLLLLFAGVTRFVLHRRKKRTTSVEGEERETVIPVVNVRVLLNSLLRSLGFGKHASNEDQLAALRGDSRWAPTIRIRERFAEYLVWTRSLGFGRDEHVTPSEHSAHVSLQMPGSGARGDVAELTAIYYRARYGSTPATIAEAEAADLAWRRLIRSAKSRA
jgi:hypothetical protein